MDINTRIGQWLSDDRLIARLAELHILLAIILVVSALVRKMLNHGAGRLVRWPRQRWLHGVSQEAIHRIRFLLFWCTVPVLALFVVAGVIYHMSSRDVRGNLSNWFQHWSAAEVLRMGLALGLLPVTMAFAFRVFRRLRVAVGSTINVETALRMLADGCMDRLAQRLQLRMSPTIANGQTILDVKAAAHFWIGLLPERLINEMNQLDALMSLLTSAEKALHQVIKLAPLYVEGHRAMARNLWMQGRHQESLCWFQSAEVHRLRFLEAIGIDANAAALLPVNCAHVIGLMGHLDAFIKQKIMNDDQRSFHLVVPEKEIVNKAFFEYWKPHVTLQQPNIDSADYVAVQAGCSVDWNWAIPQCAKAVTHVHAGIARIQRRWVAEGRAPLLALSAVHAQLLCKYKAACGMKEKDWFVCLHVRSAGFYGDKKHTAQDFRNTPIEDYYQAINAVVDAGGWIFRMGDSSAPPLQLDANLVASRKVIDYAHSQQRSPDLDVVLSAACRLFISSNSGLHTVAHAFGRPVCYVNYPIYAGFPWHPNEIITPMLYHSIDRHKVISMEEILASDLVHADHNHLFVKNKITLLRNTPDEIAETVREAMMGEEYRLPGMQSAEKARRAFERLNQKYNRDISGQISLYFAGKHQDKLFPEDRRILQEPRKECA